MGFIFDPDAKQEALSVLGDIMLRTKREMEHSLPFAMDPVVFDYRVNEVGTVAELCDDGDDTNDGGRSKLSVNNSKDISAQKQDLDGLLEQQGFDMAGQEQIRSDLRSGVIGLSKNRISLESELSDVKAEDVIIADDKSISKETYERGLEALKSGSVGVVTLAAGIGSRWTQGAGVVKVRSLPITCLY